MAKAILASSGPGAQGQGMDVPAVLADFFVCDVFGGALKNDLGTMEHPIFSLPTRLDWRVLQYDHNYTRIEVVPSVKDRATIHDKNILV